MKGKKIHLDKIPLYVDKSISGSNERPGDKPTASHSSGEGGEQGLAAEGTHDLNPFSQIDL